MRKLLIIIYFLVSAFVNGQEWAPVGAKWYYGEAWASGYNKHDYFQYTSVKDTSLRGQSCRLLKQRHAFECGYTNGDQYMFSRNDSVFFYSNQQFNLLYNFSAQKGSIWYILNSNIGVDSIKVKVDSISQLAVNGLVRKVLHVTYSIDYCKSLPEMCHDDSDSIFKYYSNKSKIIQNIGDIFYMFNYHSFDFFGCDFNYTDGLRCYEDNIIGIYHVPNKEDCTYNTTNTHSVELKPTIFPNPVKDNLTINESGNYTHYQVVNSFGVVVLGGTLNQKSINLSTIPKGLYFLKLINFNNQEFIKLIKD